MTEVKKCPKCNEKMVRGSDQTLDDAFRCTRPLDPKMLEQYVYKIQPHTCENCGYIEFYKEKKE